MSPKRSSGQEPSEKVGESSKTPLRRSTRASSKSNQTNIPDLEIAFEKITLDEPSTSTAKSMVPTKKTANSKSKKTFTKDVEEVRDAIKNSDCDEVYQNIFSPQSSQQSPIAVIIAGPAGAGKSTVYKSVLPSWFVRSAQYVNVDNYVEFFMDKYNMFTNPSDTRAPTNYTLEEIRSLNASALSKGSQCTESDLEKWMTEKRHLMIDKPCDSEKVTRELVDRLRKASYDVYMLLVNVTKETAMKRNNPYLSRSSSAKLVSLKHKGRERQLPDIAVAKIWEGVDKNIKNGVYQSIFIDTPEKLVIVNNDEPTTIANPSASIKEASDKWIRIFPSSSKTKV